MKTNVVDESAKSKMEKSLEAYKKDKSGTKEFYPYSQQLSVWLEEKGK